MFIRKNKQLQIINPNQKWKIWVDLALSLFLGIGSCRNYLTPQESFFSYFLVLYLPSPELWIIRKQTSDLMALLPWVTVLYHPNVPSRRNDSFTQMPLRFQSFLKIASLQENCLVHGHTTFQGQPASIMAGGLLWERLADRPPCRWLSFSIGLCRSSTSSSTQSCFLPVPNRCWCQDHHHKINKRPACYPSTQNLLPGKPSLGQI